MSGQRQVKPEKKKEKKITKNTVHISQRLIGYISGIWFVALFMVVLEIMTALEVIMRRSNAGMSYITLARKAM